MGLVDRQLIPRHLDGVFTSSLCTRKLFSVPLPAQRRFFKAQCPNRSFLLQNPRVPVLEAYGSWCRPDASSQRWRILFLGGTEDDKQLYQAVLLRPNRYGCRGCPVKYQWGLVSGKMRIGLKYPSLIDFWSHSIGFPEVLKSSAEDSRCISWWKPAGFLGKHFVAIKCQASCSLGHPSCGLPASELARIAPT